MSARLLVPNNFRITVSRRCSYSGDTVYRLENSREADVNAEFLLTMDETRFTGCGAACCPRIRKATVDRAFVDRLLAELGKVPAHACPEQPAAVGGWSTTIEVRCGFNRVVYDWRQDPPEQWKGLVEVVRMMSSAFYASRVK